MRDYVASRYVCSRDSRHVRIRCRTILTPRFSSSTREMRETIRRNSTCQISTLSHGADIDNILRPTRASRRSFHARSSLQDRNKRSSLSLFLRVAFSFVPLRVRTKRIALGGRNDDERRKNTNDERKRERERERAHVLPSVFVAADQTRRVIN